MATKQRPEKLTETWRRMRGPEPPGPFPPDQFAGAATDLCNQEGFTEVESVLFFESCSVHGLARSGKILMILATSGHKGAEAIKRLCRNIGSGDQVWRLYVKLVGVDSEPPVPLPAGPAPLPAKHAPSKPVVAAEDTSVPTSASAAYADAPAHLRPVLDGKMVLSKGVDAVNVDAVKWVQAQLTRLDLLPEMTGRRAAYYGQYTTATHKAVMQIQSANSLEPTGDVDRSVLVVLLDLWIEAGKPEPSTD